MKIGRDSYLLSPDSSHTCLSHPHSIILRIKNTDVNTPGQIADHMILEIIAGVVGKHQFKSLRLSLFAAVCDDLLHAQILIRV